MKNYALVILLLPFLLSAQNTFVKTIGTSQSDFGTSCIPVADGGSVLTICGGSATGTVQFGLVKTNHNGEIVWKHMFAHGYLLYAQQVISMPDGGFLVFGNKKVSAESYNTLFLLRTDQDGNELWIRSLATSMNDKAAGLIACSGGGFVTCSVKNSNTGGYPSALLIKYDDNGNLLWSREFGGSYNITPTAVTEMPDGSIAFVSGAKFAFAQFGHTLVTKTDASGNLLWSSFFFLDYDDEPYDIAADAAGELYVSGTTYRDGHQWDGFLLKVSSAGARLFNRFYNAGTSDGEKFRNVLPRPDGSVLLLGDVGSFEERDITLLSASGSSGQVQWAKRYPLSTQFTNYPYDLYRSSDGSILFTGDVRSPSYVRDAALIRTDAAGNIPCFNNEMTYEEEDTPFAVITMFLNAIDVVLPQMEPVLSLQPLEIITEKTVCENKLPLPGFGAGLNGAAVCPQSCLSFSDSTLNDPESWFWEFEGGTPATATDQHPQNICYGGEGVYTVKLTVTNSYGAVTATKQVLVTTDCSPVIPNVVTPNGDGVNDLFFIQALPADARYRILNRWGSEVFVSDEHTKSWDGKDKTGNEVSDGVYFYFLETPDGPYHGFVQVVR